MRISDWSSDVCSSDLPAVPGRLPPGDDPCRGKLVEPPGAAPAGRQARRAGGAARAADFSRRTALRGVVRRPDLPGGGLHRSEEHTSELQSLMRISYAVFCLKKKNTN